MPNVSNESTENRVGTPVLRSNEGQDTEARWYACPSWCVHNELSDVGHPTDETVLHFGPETWAGSTPVQLYQLEFIDGKRDPVHVILNGELLPLAEAAHVGALLTHAVASGSGTTPK
jgi:hypothetical protein